MFLKVTLRAEGCFDGAKGVVPNSVILPERSRGSVRGGANHQICQK